MDKNGDFYLGKLKMPECFSYYAPALVLVFIFLAIIYANSFHGTWIFDDEPNILENDNVHVERLDFKSLKNSLYNLNDELNRPLAFLSFGVNYYFGNTDPFGYHLVNFTIHFLAACFLFLLIVKTLNLPLLRNSYSRHAYSIALMATVFWAINPLHVTAVTYIVQRMASMAGLFCVMCMYFYVLGRTSQKRRRQFSLFAVSSLCALLGLASKQNVAMLPVSIFLYDLFLIQGVSQSTVRKNLAVAAVPLCILLVLGVVYTDFSTILSGYANRPFALGERLLTEPRVLFFYVSQLLYPIDSRLTLVHEVHVSTGLFSPVTTFFSIAGIIGAAGFALFRGAKYPLLGFSILFFLVNHAIEGTFIPLELIYEHRNYIPSFFFFVPIAVFIVKALEYFSYRKGLQAAIALLVVIVWIGQGHTVYLRNQRFADPVALWSDNAEKAPGLSRVHINLGNTYFDKKDYDMAYECYMRAKKADWYNDIRNEGTFHYNLGRYHFHVTENLGEALYHEQVAKELYPGKWQAWYYLILCEIGLEQLEKALELADKACRMWPQNMNLQYVKAFALLKHQDYQECINSAREAFERGLARGRFYKLVGIASLYTGDLDKAARLLKMAHEKQPADEELMMAMMETYQEKKDFEARNQVVHKIMCKKGALSWKEYISNAAEENAWNAYESNLSRLQKIIRCALQSMTP